MKQPWLKKKGYWKRKCFGLVSEIVKLRDKRCIETNANYDIQAAHIVSRTYKATAFDLDNVVTLKRSRHKWYTHNPLEWKKFINEKLGAGYYERMEKRALNYKTWTLNDLKELYAKLKAHRDTLFK